MHTKSTFPLIVYGITGLLQAAGVFLKIPILSIGLKPLLMPILMWWIWVEGRKANGIRDVRLIYGALFFSWLGDLFLMVPGDSFIFFLAGLVSFLLAHLTYILWFSARVRGHRGFLRRQPVWILPVALFYIGFMGVLLPHIAGGLKVAVMVYAFVICGMLLSVAHTRGILGNIPFRMVLAGAVSFVLSDSLLALNKFTPVGELAAIMPGMVMVTYILAQGLLAGGMLQAREGAGVREAG